ERRVSQGAVLGMGGGNLSAKFAERDQAYRNGVRADALGDDELADLPIGVERPQHGDDQQRHAGVEQPHRESFVVQCDSPPRSTTLDWFYSSRPTLFGNAENRQGR